MEDQDTSVKPTVPNTSDAPVTPDSPDIPVEAPEVPSSAQVEPEPIPETPVEQGQEDVSPGAQAETTPVSDTPSEPDVTPPPVPTTTNQVDVNNRLLSVIQDVEDLLIKLESLRNVGADVAELDTKIHEARDWVADKVGLMKNEQGNLVPKV